MSVRLASVLVLALLSSGAWGAEICPIVEAETGFLVGASRGKKWLPPEEAAKGVSAKTKFRLYSLTGEVGAAQGSKPESAGAPCDETLVVTLTPKPEKTAAVAVSAPWNPLPRTPRLGATTQAVYIEAIREFLEGRGLKKPRVKIGQIVRIDLEGDGEEEVLISGTHYSGAPAGTDAVPSASSAGNYSFVLLRRVVKGKVETQVIAAEIYPKALEFNAPARYQVAAVLDLDGDGKMEVVLTGEYYEGAWMTVHRCTEAEVSELLSAGCGA